MGSPTAEMPTSCERPSRKTPGLPPGPRLPMPLQTAIWARRATWMLEQCMHRFGPTFTLEIAYEGVWVFVTNPEDIKRVFTASPEVALAGEANRILLPIVGENSLLLLDRGPHLQQRKLLLPPLHGERMKQYADDMREVAATEIDRWPAMEPHRLRLPFQAITLEIIVRTVFGVSDGPRHDQLSDRLRGVLDLGTDPKTLFALLALGPDRIRNAPVFKRRIDAVDEVIAAEIADRRNQGDLADREDILSLLLQARDEEDKPMSGVEVRDELMTLLVAGHETTANSLAWAVERLARYPSKLQRLREEVAAGEQNYLRACVQETLRLRPVIALVNRKLTEPFEIEGYTLPAGVKVAPCIHLVHRRGDIYPDPKVFRPERFLEEPPGTYTWIPFGGGVRRCIGAAFAQFEMEIVLEELIRRWDITPTRTADERNLRRAITETPHRDAEILLSRV